MPGVKVVLQRVSEASVAVDGEVVSRIGRGLLLLVGIARGDTSEEIGAAVAKITALRVFGDDAGQMNRSVADVQGEILVVSQFTLLGDARRGRRPSFSDAAPPEVAKPLVDLMVGGFEGQGIPTGTGVFGARMEVGLINEGPVTLTLEFRDGKPL
jgi:D-aminoacyl-tRNA deacylase